MRSILLSLFAWLLPPLSCAAPTDDAAGEERTVHFEIDAERATSSLPKFIQQSGVAVKFSLGELRVATRAIHGDFTPSAALARMLDGTGLYYTFTDSSTVTITAQSPTKDRPERASSPSMRQSAQRDGPHTMERTDRRSMMSPIEQIVIRSRRDTATLAHAAPIITLTRREIEQFSVTAPPEVLRTLPQVFGGGPTEDTVIGNEARSNTGRGAGVNLRGLGAGSTLVLMNSHRLAAGGSEDLFVDVTNLPLSVIERIEILPDSSSTLYGADAVGGVLNFVMMKSFDGQQTTLHESAAAGGQMRETSISHLVGISTDSGRGLVSFDVYSRGPLQAASRRQARSNLVAFGGSNFDTMQSNPATIIADGQTWAVPAGQDGTALTPASFVRGTANLSDLHTGEYLEPMQKRAAGFATWQADLPYGIGLSADAQLTRRSHYSIGPGLRAQLLVPPANAFFVNPTGTSVPVQVDYDFRDDMGPLITSGTVDTSLLALVLESDAGRSLHATIAGTYASNRESLHIQNAVDSAALNVALADQDPATAFNPFGDGSHTNPQTLEKLRRDLSTRSTSVVETLDAKLYASPFEIDGAPANLVLGGEYREQQFDISVDGLGAQHDRETMPARRVTAAYAAARIPLIGASQRSGLQNLEISLAGRYENYSDFGHAITPRFGATWFPFKGLDLRATWSRSIRPPGMMDLNESTNAVSLFPMPDSTVPGGISPVLIWSGRNARLKEERARTWTLGLDMQPPWLPGAEISFTVFNTQFGNRVQTPVLRAGMLSDPQYAPLITRAPSSEQRDAVCRRALLTISIDACAGFPIAAIIDVRTHNGGSLATWGADLLEKFTIDLPQSELTLTLDATAIRRFAESTSFGFPRQDLVDTQSYPLGLRGRAAVTWKRGALQTDLSVSYAGNYWDIGTAPVRRVSSWTTVDVNLSYSAPADSSSWLHGTTLAVNVENVANTPPPFVNNVIGIGYDQENADLTGRVVGVTVRKKW